MNLFFGDIKIDNDEIEIFFEQFNDIIQDKAYFKSTWENLASGHITMHLHPVPAKTLLFQDGALKILNKNNFINALQNPQIREIGFENIIINAKDTRILELALHNKESLNAIYIKNCEFSNETLQKICNALKTCSQLNTIVFNGNCVDIQPIIELTYSNQSISIVYLNDNLITDEEVPLIVDTLMTNDNLRKLYLTDNRITANGVRLIADTLKTNNTLHKLSLKNNRIGNEGAFYLSEGLSENKSLYSLNLKNNGIDISGTTALIESIIYHPKLERFDLTGNHIDHELASYVLQDNYNLIIMENNNPLFKSAISKILDRNMTLRNIRNPIESLYLIKMLNTKLTCQELLEKANIEKNLEKLISFMPETEIKMLPKNHIINNLYTILVSLKALKDRRPCDALHLLNDIKCLPSLDDKLTNWITLNALLMPELQEIIPATNIKQLYLWLFDCRNQDSGITSKETHQNNVHLLIAKEEILNITEQYIATYENTKTKIEEHPPTQLSRYSILSTQLENSSDAEVESDKLSPANETRYICGV